MSTICKQRPILNIYTGPMFAGKTTRLIKHYNRLKVDNELEKIAFKFSKDTRYETEKDQDNTDILGRKMIYSHDKKYIPSIPISSCQEIVEKLKLINDKYNILVKYIFIDEGQFFPKIKEWYNTINLEIKNGNNIYLSSLIEVNISGLDYDANGNIFNPQFYSLFSIANYLLVAHSKCYICGENAFYTILIDKKNKSEMDGNVLVGDNTIYQPACSKHINFTINR
tara:strand:- start:126 stop:800 length:675 start_codon:yes stop_codon:yes gene_type:complete